MNVNDYLSKLYSLLNLLLFKNELPPVIINIEPRKTKSSWRLKSISKYKSIIGVNPKSLTEEEAYVQMIHQMIHIYNKLHDISDASRGGQYHNHRFNAKATEIGLKTTRDDKGWHTVGIEEYLLKKIRSQFNFKELEDAIKSSDTIFETTAVLRNMQKFKCPKCQRIIQAFPTNKLICGFDFCEYIRFSERKDK